MKWSKLFRVGLVLLLALSLSESATAADNFSELLANSGRLSTLNHITEHGGQVYASGFLCKPEWNPVPGVNIYTGGFVLAGDVFVYTRSQGTGAFPTELYRSDVRGGGETVITGDADSSGGVWAIGGKVLYTSVAETPNYEYVYTGVFCYDVTTSKKTRLLGALSAEDFFSPVSFDDDFVYYRLRQSGDVRRIRWDGSGDEVMKGLQLPADVYTVEGQYYYCVSTDYDEDKTKIHRYTTNGGSWAGVYTIDAAGLIAIQGGSAYFGNTEGIFKMDMDTGTTIRLAALVPKVQGWCFGTGTIIGNDLYLSACYDSGEDGANTRLYKVPLDGGKMEYQNVEWFES